jgi:hypothetical protein
MVLRPQQVPFLARKIVINLLNSGLVTFPKQIERAREEVEAILMEDVEWEREIEEKAHQILEEQEEEQGFEFYSVDRRELFKLIKRKLAEEEGFPIELQERVEDLSDYLVKELWDQELIDYDVVDGKIKNIVFKTIWDFLTRDRVIRARVHEKLENYKRKLIPGSEEYELMFKKLYEQELRREGII